MTCLTILLSCIIPGIAVAGSKSADPWRDRSQVSSPSIAFQPSPQAAIVGSRVHFTVIASGEPPLSYRWRKNGVDLSDDQNVVGSASDVLTLNSIRMVDAGDYSVTVSNSSGNASSVDAALTLTAAQDGDVDPSFEPGSSLNEAVHAIAVQADGKVLIGGVFTTVHGAARGRIARLNHDGSTDHTFGNGLGGVNGDVTAIAVLSDRRVLVGGDFTAANGIGRNHLAMLNADGSLDTTFLNGVAGTNGIVLSLVAQPDGRLLIGGNFSTVNGVGRSRIARLNADGSVDGSFLNGLSGTNGAVTTVALQPDGRVLIGGYFDSVNGVGRSNVARLNVDGSLDASFSNVDFAFFNSYVSSLALQPDGRVLIGGSFSSVNGVNRNLVARLNADGSLDATFQNGLPNTNGNIASIALEADGRMVLGGGFRVLSSGPESVVARLNPDGTIDASFTSGLATSNPVFPSINVVAALARQPDGEILVGGNFGRVDGTSPNFLTRIKSDGTIDAAFQNGASATSDAVASLAVQSDGGVVIGGSFTMVHGVSRNNIARLHPDGSLDTAFLNGLAGTDRGVGCLAVQPDGRIVIGGSFTSVNEVSRNRIARLNPDGSLDTTFLNGLSGADGRVTTIALQSDGRILIGGDFLSVNGETRQFIARLNADGTLDTPYMNGHLGANDQVFAIALQPDGRALVAGGFTVINSFTRFYIARLNVNGTVDTSFLGTVSGPNSSVLAVTPQPDGRILIGGGFTAVNGVSRSGLARLYSDGTLDTSFSGPAMSPPPTIVLQPDGRMLVGRLLKRLNSDGSVDTSFRDFVVTGISDYGGSASSVVLQPTGRVLVGGTFRMVNGTAVDHVVRLYSSAPVAATITSEPASQISYDGCCARFAVGAVGSPVDYQWKKDGADLVDGPRISGAHTAELTVTEVTDLDNGAYSVIVSNLFGSDTSLDATLTVTTVPACNTAACNESGCGLSSLPYGTACTDGNACTQSDQCQFGWCVGSSPVVCSAADQCHDAGVCNPGTGLCSNPAKTNGAACNDGTLCTSGDACIVGECHGIAISCLDNNVCTTDTCHPATGCVYNNNTNPCNDGNPCTVNDTCGPLTPLTQDFDGVSAPALPLGWTSLVTGAGTPWVTRTGSTESGPNSVFGVDSDLIADEVLDSPPISVSSTTAMLTFRNRWNFDDPDNCFDAGVLEIKIGAAPFADILAAGGTFLSGGYTGNVSPFYGSPLSGRAAWCSTSAGYPAYLTTAVSLPAAVAGQTIRLRWRIGSDSSAAVNGQDVDSIVIADPTNTCQSGTPINPPPETQNVVAGADKSTYTWSAATYATNYDVVRGGLGALPPGPGAGDEVCFDDLAATLLQDVTLPSPGTGFWYLSRGENACGVGTYGTRSDGMPRTTTTCP